MSKWDIYNSNKVKFAHSTSKIYIKKEGYSVLKTADNSEDIATAKILKKLDKTLNNILQNIDVLTNKPSIIKLLQKDIWLIHGLELLQKYHNTTKSLQEIEPDIGFWGINYPYGVNNTGIVDIGTDQSLRAKKRIIYLTIRGKTYDWIEKLIIHELSHTVCNDVVYRSEHSDYFKKAEILIEKLWFS